MERIAHSFKQKAYWFCLWLFLVVGINGVLGFLSGPAGFINLLNTKFNFTLFALYYGYACVFLSFVFLAWFALKRITEVRH